VVGMARKLAILIQSHLDRARAAWVLRFSSGRIGKEKAQVRIVTIE
jgi:hypothetical protein